MTVTPQTPVFTIEFLKENGYVDTGLSTTAPGLSFIDKTAQSLNITVDSIKMFHGGAGNWLVVLKPDARGPYKSEPILP